MEKVLVDGGAVSAPGDSLDGGHEAISFGPGDIDNPVNWPFVCSPSFHIQFP